MEWKHEQIPYAKLCDEMDVSVIIIGYNDGKLLHVNREVTKNMRMAKEDMIGRHFSEIFTVLFIRSYEELLMDCADGGTHTTVHYWVERNIWEQVSAVRVEVGTDQPVLLLTITNITEVSREKDAFRQLLYYDQFLNLPNGFALERDIGELATDDMPALLYFQLERFEDLNALYGIEVGNALLEKVRDWLVLSEPKQTRLYRVGDGFAILADKASMEDAVTRSREILRRFDRPWKLAAGGQKYELYRTIKLGIVFGKYVRSNMRNLLMRTMHAPNNRDGYVVYDEAFDLQAQAALRRSLMLVDCMQRDMAGFEVYYHPIVEAGTHRWVGAEALCRWTTPDGEAVPPAEFIHMVERLEMIDRLDNWVREVAMSECVAWGLSEKDFFLDVNFSPTQDVDDVFIDGLMDSLYKTGYPAIRLNMEITESAKMRFTEENLRGLRYLANKGIQLSLDDFGTGYSSIENLIRLPASALKTEKMFIDELEKDDYRKYIMSLLIGVAHHLNMRLIAEGVETQAQCDILEALGADYFQGYYFSEPLSSEAFAREVHRFGDKKDEPGG